MLDEVPQSYSHQGNLKLDQTKYTVETWDHKYVDSEVSNYFQGSMHFVRKKDMLS